MTPLNAAKLCLATCCAFCALSAPAQTLLAPTADAYVRDGTYASTNYGTATDLLAKQSTTSYRRISYLKFDLSAVSGTLASAKLRLHARLSGPNAGTISGAVYPVSNSTWSETTITWNNRPALGASALRTVAVTSTTATWHEWDVTAYLNAELAASRKVVTLALVMQSTANPLIVAASRENAANPPELKVGTGASTYFVHTDHLNTPRVITNSASQIVWRWDNLDAFGANAANENPSGLGTFTCNLRLPGQYFDKETNLHYNYFRDYDPGIGRYVQSDPIGLRGGMNTYAYAESNPVPSLIHLD